MPFAPSRAKRRVSVSARSWVGSLRDIDRTRETQRIPTVTVSAEGGGGDWLFHECQPYPRLREQKERDGLEQFDERFVLRGERGPDRGASSFEREIKVDNYCKVCFFSFAILWNGCG